MPKDPSGGDGDVCHTVFNEEYELRRTGTQYNVYFNIYPSPADGNRVIYIQGRDRRTACLDRSFLQWTEEACAVTKNVNDPTYNISELYEPTEPTLAHINLVGPLQASKWIIEFPSSDIY